MIFSNRSIMTGQSTCCSMSVTTLSSDLKKSSISSILRSSSDSFTLVK
jgi:hypothetical protein